MNKLSRFDYFGIFDLLRYLWGRLLKRPHVFGAGIHRQAIEEAMKKYQEEKKSQQR